MSVDERILAALETDARMPDRVQVEAALDLLLPRARRRRTIHRWVAACAVAAVAVALALFVPRLMRAIPERRPVAPSSRSKRRTASVRECRALPRRGSPDAPRRRRFCVLPRAAARAPLPTVRCHP